MSRDALVGAKRVLERCARGDGAERGVPDDVVCVTAADRERDPFGEDQAARQLEVAAHPLLVDLEPRERLADRGSGAPV